jgi:hypothetical protein
MTRLSRKPADLSESTGGRLNSYALAASAAGVGVLALSQGAEAKIIYVPADVKINQHNMDYYIDIDHDGVEDFEIYWLGGTSTQFFNLLGVGAAGGAPKGDLVVGRDPHASALRAGATIGPKQFFSAYAGSMAGFGTSSRGQHFQGLWANGGKGLKDHYVGFRFVSKGAMHYGWFRMNVSFSNVEDHEYVSGLLTGYAYETIPNKPIVAGKTEGPEEDSVDEANSATLNEPALQPASLGLLAMGSPGLSVWRREESVDVAPETK